MLANNRWKMHHQQLCLQTTVGNVICGMRHGHCVCVSHTMSRSSWFWLCLIGLPQLSWATHIQATPLDRSKYHEPSVNPIASDTRSLEPLRMPLEGSSASTLSHIHHSGPVRQCSEVYRGWRLSFGKKSSDWEKRVFDIGIQWNKQYKQDNDGQWYKIRFASEWIGNLLIDVDRDLVMRWCYKVGSLPLWNWRRVCSARNLQMSSLPAVASVYSFRATWQEIYPNWFASITGNLIECRSGATKIYKIHAAI